MNYFYLGFAYLAVGVMLIVSFFLQVTFGRGEHTRKNRLSSIYKVVWILLGLFFLFIGLNMILTQG